MLRSLGMPEGKVFTEFTGSSFFGPQGLEATAPVFSSSQFPTLPSPLGQVFATFDNFKRLPIKDRTSIVGLLLAMLDYDRDEATFEKYDRMTAHELFIRFGVSKRLVDDFLKPTLLVGLFKPPEELSAAVVMELLYYYALAHQDSFDVRWIKRGTVATSLIKPLAESLLESGNLEVLGGCRVQEVVVDEIPPPDDSTPAEGRVTGVKFTRQDGTAGELKDLDAVVLALGANGMKAVVRGSPGLSSRDSFANAASCGAIDVCAARLWLDKYVPVENPANVFSRFDKLRGSGGTFFMLDQLQAGGYTTPGFEGEDAETERELWGGEEPQGSVVSCDFYNAGAINTLTDEEIVRTLMEDLLPSVVPEFRGAKVVDSFVQRYPTSVTWFSPGSYNRRPKLDADPSLPNLKCAGDWVRMGKREHGAKGLCQERAFVSGLQAANALVEDRILKGVTRRHQVIPVRDDELQVYLGRAANRVLMQPLDAIGLGSFWAR
mmetsp:Transcript_43754/g.137382  ORF Transcript_43754/g.137382 Transcript_43754/m.137382 type:complete len:490 (-) Transcript_43754:371-1840(-)